MADSKSGCSYSILAVCLIEDMREMIRDGFLADHQFLGNLVIASSAGNQLEHSYLTLGQVGR